MRNKALIPLPVIIVQLLVLPLHSTPFRVLAMSLWQETTLKDALTL